MLHPSQTIIFPCCNLNPLHTDLKMKKFTGHTVFENVCYTTSKNALWKWGHFESKTYPNPPSVPSIIVSNQRS